MDTQDKPRYNKVRIIDDGVNVDQKIFEKKLIQHDSYAQYSNGVLKLSFKKILRTNIANNNCIIQLPRDLLKYCWLYYDLPTFEMPKDGLRFYLIFEFKNGKGVNI